MGNDTFSFLDLEDAAAFGTIAPSTPATVDLDDISRGAGYNEATDTRWTEDCPKCHGTGNFVSYTGRIVGECFSCKGKGTRTYKTSPEARARGKVSAAKAKTKKAQALADKVAEWKAAHPAEAALLANRASSWDFAASLQDSLNKWGSLTEGQLAAVRKCVARDAERNAARAAAAKASESDLDLTDLPSGTYAVPGGDTRLKLAVQRPGKNSRYHGTIFVHDGGVYGARTNYGRQTPGALYSGKCVDQLKAVLADPKAAMAAYGQLTGTCGVCGAPWKMKRLLHAASARSARKSSEHNHPVQGRTFNPPPESNDMKPATQAQKMRAALKKAGIDPKGMIRVRNTDFDTSIILDAPGYMYPDIEDALSTIPRDDMEWRIDW